MMPQTKLKMLIEKLDAESKQCLEEAASYCLSRGHYNIELGHWFFVFLKSDNEFQRLVTVLNLNQAQLMHDLQNNLEKLSIGNEQAPAISPLVIDLINEAWLLASLEYGLDQIKSGLIFLAAFKNQILSQVFAGLSTVFQGLDNEKIKIMYEKIDKTEKLITQKPAEDQQKIELTDYTINLNQLAMAGKIDAVIGRENEIQQLIHVLARRRQNNAILTGEPGVGKTAIVEGLALKIVEKDVPDILKNVVIHSLDLGLLTAGASVKGEFERRLKSLIHAVKQAADPVILFIDEAHILIGSGAPAGQADAANLLKPALARGELHAIAATTWSEYKQYFEHDPALSRRFQVIKVEEPGTDQTMMILQNLSQKLSQYHQVKILDEAIQAAVTLSKRYVNERQLPDKAISVLDTACARVALQQNAIPISLEIKRKEKLHIQNRLEILQRELLQGINHQEDLEDNEKRLVSIDKAISEIETKWQKEKAIVEKIKHFIKVENISKPEINKIKNLKKELKKIQLKNALVSPFVNFDTVAEIIADWTGIPMKKLEKNNIRQILNIESTLKQRIIGQDHALKTIANNLIAASARLLDPGKPLGVFLFVGASGVGKTETAMALADILYGSEKNLTVINMSEFKEAHKVSLLAGAPPGYVGYGKGGVLTEAVRRKPYSIILLDEIEKAHPSVQEIFYQVFDKGYMLDSEGREINFKNTIIIMTSNAGDEYIIDAMANTQTAPDSKSLVKSLYAELEKYFKPAFLGRLHIVPYLPLTHAEILKIAKLKLQKIKDRFKLQHQVELELDKEMIDDIVLRCEHDQIGARQIDHLIDQELLPQLSIFYLNQILQAKKLNKIFGSKAADGSYQFLLKTKVIDHESRSIQKIST